MVDYKYIQSKIIRIKGNGQKDENFSFRRRQPFSVL